MATHDTDHLRNVVLLSHSGAGKTILSEAALFATNATTRLGRVEDETTTSDYEPEEHKRQNSVQTSVLPVIHKDFKINLIDSPRLCRLSGRSGVGPPRRGRRPRPGLRPGGCRGRHHSNVADGRRTCPS